MVGLHDTANVLWYMTLQMFGYLGICNSTVEKNRNKKSIISLARVRAHFLDVETPEIPRQAMTTVAPPIMYHCHISKNTFAY